MTYILGISCFYHDSAACLIKDQEIICALQEERFTRKKHDASFPKNAIKLCLDEAKISLDMVDYLVFYDKPFLKFERLLETYLSEAPRGFKSFLMAIPIWLKEKLFLKDTLIKEFFNFQLSLISNNAKINKKESKKIKENIANRILFSEHHQSHAASSFFPSPFEESAILNMDGVGE